MKEFQEIILEMRVYQSVSDLLTCDKLSETQDGSDISLFVCIRNIACLLSKSGMAHEVAFI